jgi:ribosome recycling factor
VRTGRATPTLLDNVKPEAYGNRSSLRELGSVAVEDARTLRIVPWDKTVTKAIEKAIIEADLGVGVSTDDQGLRVTFPALTAERREQLSKLAGDKTEQAKVTLRGHRTDAIKELDAAEKGGGMGKDEVARLKTEVQKLIDAGNEALQAALTRKEEEIAQ